MEEKPTAKKTHPLSFFIGFLRWVANIFLGPSHNFTKNRVPSKVASVISHAIENNNSLYCGRKKIPFHFCLTIREENCDFVLPPSFRICQGWHFFAQQSKSTFTKSTLVQILSKKMIYQNQAPLTQWELILIIWHNWWYNMAKSIVGGVKMLWSEPSAFYAIKSGWTFQHRRSHFRQNPLAIRGIPLKLAITP